MDDKKFPKEICVPLENTGRLSNADNEIIRDIISGKISLHEVEKVVGEPKKAVDLRKRAIEKLTGTNLKHISNYSVNPGEATQRNIENMIGVAQVPMGIAGPLKIEGEFARGDYFVPLATTEGALVASVSRGMSVITKSGGAQTMIYRNGITRAPVMKLPSAKHSKIVIRWIEENFGKIKAVAEHGERFLTLLRITPFPVGRNLYLRFVYDTSDAMGMNMVTFGTDQALELLESEFPFIEHVALSGNMCIDKKPSALNLIMGRGKSVIAEVEIPRKVIKDVLKTTPEAMADVNYRKNLLGSAQAGSYGFNAHFANPIAALYIATGQDAAHVVEGSHGFTTAEMVGDPRNCTAISGHRLCPSTNACNLHMAVTMPAVQVGTVGGGMQRETQQEALKILGVAGGGENNAKAFAEIVAATTLAGEISLVGALAARHLSKAHKELGRG